MTADDPVNITAYGETVRGTVILASANGRSLFVTFDGVVGRHIGAAPLLMGDDGQWRSIVDQTVMLIEPL